MEQRILRKHLDVIRRSSGTCLDMRIRIDVATLSLKGIVDRIILLSGDTDVIPAMKLARREGVQVVLVEISAIHKDLDEDADLCRRIIPVP